MNKTILIVEDQFIEANNLRLILKGAGYKVCPIARSVTEALEIIDTGSPDLVMIDILLKGGRTGIDLALILKHKEIAFVYLSANTDPETFRKAKRTGPYGFLVKPFREKDVLATLEISDFLHQQYKLFSKNDQPDKPALKVAISVDQLPGFIGKSEQMQEVIRYIKIAGPSEIPVLIYGESGTGKELIAQALHRISTRNDKPFIVVDCASLPANLVEAELFGYEKGSFTGASEKRTGKFEQANTGTIFLDEIGELSLEMQVKFLRVLQEMEIGPIGGRRRKINVRVIAATNRNLEEEVSAGRFRLDLYYRLNVFPVNVPPLRERVGDITLLAEYFLDHFSGLEKKNISGFSKEVKKALLNYGWPGNVRELRNLVSRNVLLTDGQQISNFPLPIAKNVQQLAAVTIKTLADNERDHILRALEQCKWKVYGQGGAAEILDINGSTLKSRMKKLGIGKRFTLRNASN